MNDLKYEPDFVVHPTETIAEMIVERALDNEAINWTEEDRLIIKTIFAGTSITEIEASALERTFDVPAQFWINLQAGYLEGCARLSIKP